MSPDISESPLGGKIASGWKPLWWGQGWWQKEWLWQQSHCLQRLGVTGQLRWGRGTGKCTTWASTVWSSCPTDPPRAHHYDLGTCSEPETAPLPTTPISLRPCRSFSLTLCLYCHITKRNNAGLCKALLFFFFSLCCGISPGTFIFIIVDTSSKDHTEKFWGLRCKIITVLPAPGSQRGVSWDSNLVERPKNRLVLEAGMCLDPGLPFKKR